MVLKAIFTSCPQYVHLISNNSCFICSAIIFRWNFTLNSSLVSFHSIHLSFLDTDHCHVTEAHRSRPSSGSYHPRLRLTISQSIRYPLPHQPPESISSASLGRLPLYHLSNGLLIIPALTPDLHSRTNPDRPRARLTQQFVP